jgi:hypothetical protein
MPIRGASSAGPSTFRKPVNSSSTRSPWVARRQPEERSTIIHFDHGTQYFMGIRETPSRRRATRLHGYGRRLFRRCGAGIFLGTMQLDLLDTGTWRTCEETANAVFEWIECWYKPNRRHSKHRNARPRHVRAASPPSDTIERPHRSELGIYPAPACHNLRSVAARPVRGAGTQRVGKDICPGRRRYDTPMDRWIRAERSLKWVLTLGYRAQLDVAQRPLAPAADGGFVHRRRLRFQELCSLIPGTTLTG